MPCTLWCILNIAPVVWLGDIPVLHLEIRRSVNFWDSGSSRNPFRYTTPPLPDNPKYENPCTA